MADETTAKVITFANGKGGVGKTSCAVNVAGLAASAGFRTLLVDLDHQANVTGDLGVQGDDGWALFSSIIDEEQLVASLSNVRTNLDVVSGGKKTADLAALLAIRAQEFGADYLLSFRDALSQLAGEYHLIIVDCPPAGGLITDMALTATGGLVVPVKPDAASLRGLGILANQFTRVRGDLNPDLKLLGIVLFGVSTRATKIRERVRVALETDFNGGAPLLRSVIRTSELAAFDMRQEGILAHEYEQKAAETAGVEFLQARIRGEVGGFSTAAEGLATDYADLTNELLAKLARRGIASRVPDQAVDLTDDEQTVTVALEEPVNV